MAQRLEDEAQDTSLPRHVSTVIVKEIIKAQQRGWDASRITKNHKIDPSVVDKLGNHFAVPVDNEDGIVYIF